MAITEVIQFYTETRAEKSTLQAATASLKNNSNIGHFTVGTDIKDAHTVQVTAELPNTSSNSLAESLHGTLGAPTTTFRLPHTVLQASGPATSPVVEYVQSWFPVSRATKDFRQQIEADFDKFNTILNSDGLHAGRGKLIYGWTMDPVEHLDIQGEKAVAFTVVCGWDEMRQFDESLKTEAFGKAIPTLYAWGAPYKMWHVENQIRGGL